MLLRIKWVNISSSIPILWHLNHWTPSADKEEQMSVFRKEIN
ncbi:hypothetical protein SLEP1_g3535 [Rubroshorea leprosula]|uniref:Uncharacterized protein n=1 Tax=Rubroshorea leprosula TaxID=152421 RepID=A0AAV5HW76_9ROSI|nr:hypothetical protein SLEP1_g3535 [Rubroshorea leprosula]